MKIGLLYLFLFTYATVMLKPVMPYVTDAVAHVLFFKDHMLTVHAHNGKYHVHAEMALAEKNEQQGKSTNNLKKGSYDNEHIITDKIELVSPIHNASWPFTLIIPLSDISANPHFPPPRV